MQNGKFNISLLGETQVGKTSIITVLIGQEFNPNVIATIGIDIVTRNETIDGKDYVFKIYDTAGQERYKSMSSRTLKTSNGFILVFDVKERESFNLIKEWLKDINNEVNIKETIIFLVGNKIDVEKREITKEEAKRFAEDNNMRYFETSAKSNIGIKETFHEMYKDLVKLSKNEIEEENENKKEENKKNKSKNKKDKKKMEENAKKEEKNISYNNNFVLEKEDINDNKKKKKNWFSRHCAK